MGSNAQTSDSAQSAQVAKAFQSAQGFQSAQAVQNCHAAQTGQSTQSDQTGRATRGAGSRPVRKVLGVKGWGLHYLISNLLLNDPLLESVHLLFPWRREGIMALAEFMVSNLDVRLDDVDYFCLVFDTYCGEAPTKKEVSALLKSIDADEVQRFFDIYIAKLERANLSLSREQSMSPGLGPRVSQSQRQGLGIGAGPSQSWSSGRALVREGEGECGVERATEGFLNKGRIWLLDSDPYGTYSSCSCSLNDGLSADRPSVVDRDKEEAWAVAVRPPELRALMLVDPDSGRPLFCQYFNGVVPDLAAVKAQCADALGLDPADIVLVKARDDFGSSDAFSDGPSNEGSCGCDGCSSFRACMAGEMISEVFSTMKDRMVLKPYALSSESALEGQVLYRVFGHQQLYADGACRRSKAR